MTANNEGLLSRWSRRKLQPKEVSEQEDDLLVQNQLPPGDELPAAEIEDPVAEEVESEPVLTDADMPDIEAMDEDSDFTPFMSSGVSDKLRNLALKKMFHAPVFNIRDGLDEYDEDFTTFEALGDIVTSDMKHQLELEAQKKLQADAEAEARQAEDESDSLLEEDDENNLDPTEHDLTETDITEADITDVDITESSQHDEGDSQLPSSTSSQSDSNPNTAENIKQNE